MRETRRARRARDRRVDLPPPQPHEARYGAPGRREIGRGAALDHPAIAGSSDAAAPQPVEHAVRAAARPLVRGRSSMIGTREPRDGLRTITGTDIPARPSIAQVALRGARSPAPAGEGHAAGLARTRRTSRRFRRGTRPPPVRGS